MCLCIERTLYRLHRPTGRNRSQGTTRVLGVPSHQTLTTLILIHNRVENRFQFLKRNDR